MPATLPPDVTQARPERHGWRVQLSSDWHVLGPFPIHAREQHFLSPSFPINLSYPIDYDKSWPSSYADGGVVSWTQFQSNRSGDLKVSFPKIRWATLRATEGWAALQHHSVLKTSITVYPPLEVDVQVPPRLHVQLVQGSFFTVLPSNASEDTQSEPLVPEWYSGNIYDMEQAPPQILDFPIPPSTTSPTTFDIFVSGDYEIRLFGDPRAFSDNDTPVLSINLGVEVEPTTEKVVWDSTQDVTCDFVDGYAFGDALGFGLRSVDGWWTVKSVRLSNDYVDGVSLHLLQETRIAPTQTRIVPIRIIQAKPLAAENLLLNVTVTWGIFSATVMVSLPIRHLSGWTPTNFKPIKASHFFAESMPTSFVVLPPIEKNDGKPCPPILALHGAGVKILEQDFWADSLARQKHSWVVIPTGRTSWGLDWHGPSAQDAWASVDALASIVDNRNVWQPWRLDVLTPVVLIGHSNGGQGAWFMASRYPDRVLAVVPAAGYIKSQSYVPLTMSRSGRFLDPALRAILEAALTPDDNDLFLSNLVDTPILAIHGSVSIMNFYHYSDNHQRNRQ
jgi:pimeloyl-ACP methyl ester carboxylesterase